jgi:2'-5' RNA ligase
LRLFFAVPVPPLPGLTAVRDALAARLPRARWSPPENFHITLKFLGETSEALVPALAEAAEKAARSAAPFEVSLEKFGGFSSPRGGALWAGCGDGREALAALAARLDAAAEALSFPKESRRFTPHVTLARLPRKTPADADPPSPSFGRFRAGSLALYESVSAPGGVRYVPLRSFPLSGI